MQKAPAFALVEVADELRDVDTVVREGYAGVDDR
jgi:hypothetical protein